MAGEMFGMPVGQSQADQDMARMALVGAQVQHMGVQDMMAPSTAQQRSAQARWLNARSDAAEASSFADRHIAAIAAGTPLTEADVDNPAALAARAALSGGYLDKASKYANVAAGITQKQQAADTNASRQSLIESRNRVTLMDELARSVRAVDGPDALESVIQQHARTNPQARAMLDDIGNLRPEVRENWATVADDIQGMALSEAQRTAAEYRAAQEKRLQKAEDNKQEQRLFWRDMNNQQRREEARARGRGTKAGNSTVNKITPQLGESTVQREFTGFQSDAQVKVLGRQIAERAEQFRAINPAMTPTEAAREAFLKMEEEGKFDGLNRRPALTSANRPLPLPDDKDTAKLRIGAHYTDGKDVREWLGPGKGWKIVTPSKRKIAEALLDTGRGPVRSGRIGGVTATDLEDEEADEMALEDNDEEE